MTTKTDRSFIAIRRRRTSLLLLLALVPASLVAQQPATYLPPAGQWKTASPSAVGLDSVKLQQAVEYALAHGSTWDFEKDQVRTFGTPLGPLPKQRAATNGIILRHGYIVAQFGDTKPAIRSTVSPRAFCRRLHRLQSTARSSGM